MIALPLTTLIALVVAALVGSGLGFALTRIVYGTRLREMRTRYARSEKARAQTNDLLAHAKQQVDTLQKELDKLRSARPKTAAPGSAAAAAARPQPDVMVSFDDLVRDDAPTQILPRGSVPAEAMEPPSRLDEPRTMLMPRRPMPQQVPSDELMEPSSRLDEPRTLLMPRRAPPPKFADTMPFEPQT